MWFTPSSMARRSTARAASRSAGGPQTPGPGRRIAPKPTRRTWRPPGGKVVSSMWVLQQRGHRALRRYCAYAFRMDVEVPLTGGRITQGVVRIGDEVRRPTGPCSDFAHAVLRALEA